MKIGVCVYLEMLLEVLLSGVWVVASLSLDFLIQTTRVEWGWVEEVVAVGCWDSHSHLLLILLREFLFQCLYLHWFVFGLVVWVGFARVLVYWGVLQQVRSLGMKRMFELDRRFGWGIQTCWLYVVELCPPDYRNHPERLV